MSAFLRSLKKGLYAFLFQLRLFLKYGFLLAQLFLVFNYLACSKPEKFPSPYL